MRVLIISDSHGNIVRLKHCLEFGESIGVGAVIHCGDWDNSESVKIMNTAKIPVFTSLGNADIDPDIKTGLCQAKIKYSLDFLEIEVGGRLIAVTHFPTRQSDLVKTQKYDAVFCGH